MITQISDNKFKQYPKAPKRLKPAAWKKLVDELYEDRGHACQNCGKYLNRNEVNPHHIIRRGAGGPDTLNNLSCLCTFCHNEAHR